MNLEVHHGYSHGKAVLNSQSEEVPHIDGFIELLRIPVHWCRGFTQNDVHLLQESPADGKLLRTAASDRGVPEARTSKAMATCADHAALFSARTFLTHRLKFELTTK